MLNIIYAHFHIPGLFSHITPNPYSVAPSCIITIKYKAKNIKYYDHICIIALITQYKNHIHLAS